LIIEDLEINFEFDIIYLRRAPPRKIVQSGDIKNRVKTLFDSLQAPGHCDEFPKNVESG